MKNHFFVWWYKALSHGRVTTVFHLWSIYPLVVASFLHSIKYGFIKLDKEMHSNLALSLYVKYDTFFEIFKEIKNFFFVSKMFAGAESFTQRVLSFCFLCNKKWPVTHLKNTILCVQKRFSFKKYSSCGQLHRPSDIPSTWKVNSMQDSESKYDGTFQSDCPRPV